MAISNPVLKDNGQTSTDGSSITTASITWTAGARGFVYCAARHATSGTPAQPTITGWTLVTGASISDGAANAIKQFLFYKDSPSNGTITINYGETEGVMTYNVIEVASGYNTGAPPKQAVVTGTGTGTTPTATLGSTPAADSLVFQLSTANGAPTVTAPTGFTLINRQTGTTPSIMQYASYKNGSAGTTADPTYNSSVTWSQMLVEIGAAGASNATPTPSTVSGSVAISAAISCSVEKTVAVIVPPTVTVGAPALSMTVELAALNATAAMDSMSAQLSVDLSVTGISRTVAIGTPTVFTETVVVASPAVVSGSVAIGAPSLSTGSIVAPAVVAGTPIIDPVGLYMSVEAQVALIAVLSTVDTPTIVQTATVDWEVDVLAPQSFWTFGKPRLVSRPGGNMIRIPSFSTEYVKVPVRVRESGAFVDPTDQTVEFALTAGTDEPTDADWHTASWETDSGRYFARCLIGPDGDADPGDGTWNLWVRVAHSPELIARRAGVLVVS